MCPEKQWYAQLYYRRIINKWNGYRPPAYLLIGSFIAYLVGEKIKEIQQRQGQFITNQRYQEYCK